MKESSPLPVCATQKTSTNTPSVLFAEPQVALIRVDVHGGDQIALHRAVQLVRLLRAGEHTGRVEVVDAWAENADRTYTIIL